MTAADITEPTRPEGADEIEAWLDGMPESIRLDGDEHQRLVANHLAHMGLCVPADLDALLAAQEPTEALVDEIAEQLDYEDDPWDRTDPDITWGLPGNERAEAYRDLVRRVLTARAARRDEEDR